MRLGKYVLDAPLGMGGMAEVFRAHTVGAEGFERPVAIKRVLPDASRNPAFAEMFVAEAKLSSRLQHPNIVSVLDFDRDHDGRLYLVMELVEGRDLDGIIESGRLPFSVIIYAIIEILRGLGYAHDLPMTADGIRGLIHRDISPHNVLCSWSGAVKVSDFGIAKARAATAASASVTIKGKPAYMSPEQISGAPLDGRSDLFAVGVMMWQMLTGQYLFAAGSTTETLARVLFSNITPPGQLVGDIPVDLEAVTMKLLARDAAERYQSAEDAIDDLLRCAHAPRDGRRELEALLAERFPHKAPVRTGQRARAAISELAQGTPPSSGQVGRYSPSQLDAMAAPTRTGSPGSGPIGAGAPPVAAMPTAAPAATAIAAPPTAPRGSRLGLIIVAAVAALAALVVAIVVLGGGSTSKSPPTAAPSTVPVDAPAPIDAGVDAPELDAAPPIDAAEPVDAGPPIDSRKRPRNGGGSGSSGIIVVPTGG